MKNLSLIAAIGENRELGYKKELLYHIREDLMFYKKMTMGKNIIMGRVTMESMPSNALIGRKPIVLTRNFIQDNEKIKYFNNVDMLLEEIVSSNEEYMVVGGAAIYRQFIKYVDTMYLTTIYDKKEVVADCYFPEFNINDWKITPLIEGIDKDVIYKIREYKRDLNKKLIFSEFYSLKPLTN